MPRAIIASLAGISLSLSGLIYQETFQNDLISQDLLGVSQGAGIGAAIGIVFGLSNFFIISLSFSFGILTVLLTVLISNIFKNKNNITLILSGIIVGSFMSSILTSIKYLVNPETQLATIVYWLMGSFANVTYQNILFVFPIVLILSAILFFISHRINLVALGKEETETKGVNYILYRNLIVAIATLLTATIVSICGTISWVGLITPHIVRVLLGRNVNRTLPFCTVFGATFTLIADALSRSLAQSEIPISAITGVLGSIIFTIILFNRYNQKGITKNDINVIDNIKFAENSENVSIKNDAVSLLCISNLYYKYNKQSEYILNNISLCIKQNDFILLYGANGSGKTTLLKLIAGILKPTFGNVLIKFSDKLQKDIFVDINKLSLLDRSKYISYVRQDFYNISNILVRDYLILGMVNELKFYEKPTKEQMKNVEKFANELSIAKFLDKKFSELSGGEKQLVAICQSLLQNSSILIFDEPTASLDSDNQELVISTLTKLTTTYNKTIILSTHNKEHKNTAGCTIKILKEGAFI
ncbi:MAG: iron chelate uptake ABC transporter family permease subunit [Lachnospiraceae bacterium]|nr:iron chelate uptake ABC transporter family permease subunit [Lachnospiraceae bacterium]